MVKEIYCSECKEKFQDGEIVAQSSDGDYHTVARQLYAVPIDCSMKRAMKGVAIFNRKIYYQGGFYDLSKIDKLKSVNELEIDFNEKKTGDIIKGDLRGLSKKLFGIF